MGLNASSDDQYNLVAYVGFHDLIFELILIYFLADLIE
jgi:hypothetical protein